MPLPLCPFAVNSQQIAKLLQARKVALDEEVRAEVTRKGHLEELLEANQVFYTLPPPNTINPRPHLSKRRNAVGFTRGSLHDPIRACFHHNRED